MRPHPAFGKGIGGCPGKGKIVVAGGERRDAEVGGREHNNEEDVFEEGNEADFSCLIVWRAGT